MITARVIEERRDGYYTTFIIETTNLFVKIIHEIEEYHDNSWQLACLAAAQYHRDFFGPNGKDYYRG